MRTSKVCQATKVWRTRHRLMLFLSLWFLLTGLILKLHYVSIISSLLERHHINHFCWKGITLSLLERCHLIFAEKASSHLCWKGIISLFLERHHFLFAGKASYHSCWKDIILFMWEETSYRLCAGKVSFHLC